MQSLHAALGRAERTALAPLLLAYWCQARCRPSIAPRCATRSCATCALSTPCRARWMSDADEDDLPWLRAVAATYRQPHVGRRLPGAGAGPHRMPPPRSPGATTRCATRYLDAVSLRRSLLVDLDRTGDTVMELVHETDPCAHAAGPRWLGTARRSAVLYLEMLLF